MYSNTYYIAFCCILSRERARKQKGPARGGAVPFMHGSASVLHFKMDQEGEQGAEHDNDGQNG